MATDIVPVLRGEGLVMTYYKFLGPEFMDFLQFLKANRVDRIVFWFN